MRHAPSYCIQVHAGGRREVLRRLPAELERQAGDDAATAPWQSDMTWEAGQPSLTLWPSSDASAGPANDWVAMIEGLLDQLMHRFPWREQPLLDWVGADVPRRLAVTCLVPGHAGDGLPTTVALPPRLRRGLRRVLDADGSVVKDIWIHVLYQALAEELIERPQHHSLYARIPESLQPAVEQRLARVSAVPVQVPPDRHALWPVVRDTLRPLDPARRAALLAHIARRLVFRPDEQAYLMLLAVALHKTPQWSPV